MNTITITGITFLFPNKYEFLTKKQVKKLAKICTEKLSYTGIRYKLLKGLCRTVWQRLLIDLLTFTHLQQLLALTDFIVKTDNFILMADTVLYPSEKLSFIEFIRLHGLFSLNHAENEQATQEYLLKIIATCYHATGKRYEDKELPTKVAALKDLHPLLVMNALHHIRQQFDQLITSFPTIFKPTAQSGGSVDIAEQQTNWTNTALAVAENILDLDAVLHSPAEYILFDIQYKMQQAEEIKNSKS
jgi:hypothetical protein